MLLQSILLLSGLELTHTILELGKVLYPKRTTHSADTRTPAKGGKKKKSRFLLPSFTPTQGMGCWVYCSSHLDQTRAWPVVSIHTYLGLGQQASNGGSRSHPSLLLAYRGKWQCSAVAGGGHSVGAFWHSKKLHSSLETPSLSEKSEKMGKAHKLFPMLCLL